jgi:hypothetical protein
MNVEFYDYINRMTSLLNLEKPKKAPRRVLDPAKSTIHQVLPPLPPKKPEVPEIPEAPKEYIPRCGRILLQPRTEPLPHTEEKLVKVSRKNIEGNRPEREKVERKKDSRGKEATCQRN